MATPTPAYFYNGPLGDKIPADSKALLTEYSKIPEDDLEDHIKSIRDRAWKISPYPCIALFGFIRLDLARHPAYDKVLKLLQDPGMDDQPRYLDLACCAGQNIRKLVFDGIPADAVYGSDLQADFLDLGFDLFHDRDRFPDPSKHFFAADLFTADSTVEVADSPWKALEGKFRVINATSFLHLFDYNTQLRACCIIARLLDQQSGAIFTGSQLGRSEPGEVPRKEFSIRTPEGGEYPVKTRYLHSPSTFEELWNEVGRITGASFQVDVVINLIKNAAGDDPAVNAIRPGLQELKDRLGTSELIVFTVTRVASG